MNQPAEPGRQFAIDGFVQGEHGLHRFGQDEDGIGHS
jgi:hypothetical protein